MYDWKGECIHGIEDDPGNDRQIEVKLAPEQLKERIQALQKEQDILLKTIESQKEKHKLLASDKAINRRLKPELLIRLITETARITGTVRACEAAGLSTATYYRHLNPKSPPVKRVYAPSPEDELKKQEVIALLKSDRFSGCSPRQIFSVLENEGKFVCSVSTLYRIRRRLDAA